MLNKQGEGKIDWTDYTWNPVSGCKKMCEYCYLQRIHGFDMTPKFHETKLSEPLTIEDPAKFFVCSSGDLFGDWVPDAWIQQVIDVTIHCPQHTFQFLTKNPKRYQRFVFPKNCWLGTTVDGTDNTEGNLETLQMAKNKNLKFVSFEPLLKEVFPNLEGIGWIIIGGRSGRPSFLPPKEWVDRLIHEGRKRESKIFIKDNCGFADRLKEFPEAFFNSKVII